MLGWLFSHLRSDLDGYIWLGVLRARWTFYQHGEHGERYTSLERDNMAWRACDQATDFHRRDNSL